MGQDKLPVGYHETVLKVPHFKKERKLRMHAHTHTRSNVGNLGTIRNFLRLKGELLLLKTVVGSDDLVLSTAVRDSVSGLDMGLHTKT